MQQEQPPLSKYLGDMKLLRVSRARPMSSCVAMLRANGTQNLDILAIVKQRRALFDPLADPYKITV